jgi:hypothetical protein
MPRKAMIIAPFWGHTPHLGNIRVDRFIRWLSDQDVYIILVRAGLVDEKQETAWGLEITIRDPLGKWGKPETGGGREAAARPASRFRTYVTDLLYNPDMTVMWARRLVRHRLVVEHGPGLAWVLASSPPESSQLAAYRLAKQFSTALMVDMRDGWLDEPLKSALLHSRFHRWREGRLERKILQHAKRIFVVSDGLKKMMEERLPFTRNKITLMTNGYPQEVTANSGEKPRWSNAAQISLLYAGRFTGSRNSQKAHYLIDPLLSGIRTQDRQGTIHLLGDFSAEELKDIAAWQPQFETSGWMLEVQPRVPREEAMARMAQADGLLFVTGTSVVLSAKLFEYLATGRPILAVAPENGDVWKACKDLPQVFLMPLSNTVTVTATEAVERFLKACAQHAWPYQIPSAFSEEHLSKVFLEAMGRP